MKEYLCFILVIVNSLFILSFVGCDPQSSSSSSVEEGNKTNKNVDLDNDTVLLGDEKEFLAPDFLLVVRGKVTKTEGQFFHFFQIPETHSNILTETPREGTHEVRFLGQNNKEFRSFRIAWTPQFKWKQDTQNVSFTGAIIRVSNDDIREDITKSQPFTWIIPAPKSIADRFDGVAKVQLLAQNKVTETLQISRHHPKLTNYRQQFIYSKGKLTKSALISWDSTDKDIEKLVHQVFYSHNNGKNWSLIAEELKQPKMKIDFSHFRGGKKCVFLVASSDGFNSGFLRSKVFSITNKPPILQLISPRGGRSYRQGAGIRFQGRAFDYQTREHILPKKLRWISNVDGVIGRGEKFTLRNLSVGEHVITLFIEKTDVKKEIIITIKSRDGKF